MTEVSCCVKQAFSFNNPWWGRNHRSCWWSRKKAGRALLSGKPCPCFCWSKFDIFSGNNHSLRHLPPVLRVAILCEVWCSDPFSHGSVYFAFIDISTSSTLDLWAYVKVLYVLEESLPQASTEGGSCRGGWACSGHCSGWNRGMHEPSALATSSCQARCGACWRHRTGEPFEQLHTTNG